MEVRIGSLGDDRWAFWQLFAIVNEALAADSKEITLSFAGCEYLHPNAIAILASLVLLLTDQGKNVYPTDYSLDTYAHLEDAGFWPRAPLKNRHVAGVVPFRNFRSKDQRSIERHLSNDWLGHDYVHLSRRLIAAVVSQVWELYENAFTHAGSPIGVSSCGRFIKETSTLKLSVVDFGVGIPAKVAQHHREVLRVRPPMPASALRWALTEGNTTASNGVVSRGVGFGVLRDLIVENDGKLEIYSGRAYARISGHAGEQDGVFETSGVGFPGTLVNIWLSRDNFIYDLSDSDSNVPLF